MSVVWGTVQDHKGCIRFLSHPGEGARFEIYFPATREKTDVPARRAVLDDYRGKGESILVVDDVADQRELAQAMLERLNYRVKAVASGEEALEYLANHRVDLVVLDMIMDPGMDGLETFRRIISSHPGQKAVITSGFSETDRVRKAQMLGAGPYIKKPFTLEKLAMTIRKTLDQ
ncbi:MAG: response regulator [Deltaproteobacteria bacterium]|nr:response regulator [Deltaproteobacteria bacterium]